jgi:exonuclease SbcD
MRLVYDNARTRQSREVGAAEELERKSELELFSDFYVLQNNQTMSAKQTELVRQLIQESMGCT